MRRRFRTERGGRSGRCVRFDASRARRACAALAGTRRDGDPPVAGYLVQHGEDPLETYIWEVRCRIATATGVSRPWGFRTSVGVGRPKQKGGYALSIVAATGVTHRSATSALLIQGARFPEVAHGLGKALREGQPCPVCVSILEIRFCNRWCRRLISMNLQVSGKYFPMYYWAMVT